MNKHIHIVPSQRTVGTQYVIAVSVCVHLSLSFCLSLLSLLIENLCLKLNYAVLELKFFIWQISMKKML